MPYRMIDMDSYPRRGHFDYFRTFQYPHVGTTVDMDVTGLPDWCRREKRSFYMAFIHAAALAADGVAELRQRIRGDQIIEYPECPTSHIELLEDGTYCYCTLHHHMGLGEYFAQADREREACRTGGIDEDEAVESMYFFSSLPWLHYTALVQPMPGGEDSNPRITCGQYRKQADGRVLMPVSILAHHALVDGLHISRFYGNLEIEIGKIAHSG